MFKFVVKIALTCVGLLLCCATLVFSIFLVPTAGACAFVPMSICIIGIIAMLLLLCDIVRGEL